MSGTEKKFPKEQIEAYLAAATAKLEKAIAIADDHQIGFTWEGPTSESNYGDVIQGFKGGTYSPGEIWQASGGCEWEESGENTPGEWVPNDD